MRSTREEHEAAMREQDEKHAEDISIKNEEIAAQAIDLSALRERDVEREAQIATLKRRLQEREEDESYIEENKEMIEFLKEQLRGK